MNTITKEHPIGVIGLGKMGKGIALNLKDHGRKVHVFNRSPDKTKELESDGLNGFYSLKELVDSLPKPRVLWVMLTAGDPTEGVILGKEGLINLLEEGDIVVDAANSFFKDSKRRAQKLAEKGIRFLDAGTSGGPSGARNGACIMIGGDINSFDFLTPVFKDLSVENGYKYFGEAGAGHFVKMVHNGIEYGMMQAIGEGFEVMKDSEYNLNLTDVADLYNHQSVIESRLIGWLKDGFEKYGENLEEISGSVAHSGEGLWTVQTAKEMNIPVKIIEESLNFRQESQSKPSYTGKIVSLLRNMFGGHDVSNK